MKKSAMKIFALLSVSLMLFSSASCKKPSSDGPQVPEGQYTASEFFYTPSTVADGLETSDYSVWSAYTTDKIMRHSENETKYREIYVEAAKGETESGQLILTARKDVSEYTLSVSDLKGANGTIPASAVELLVQHYIKTERPSNSAYPIGWYPDAIIPYEKIVEYNENFVSIAAGESMQNQGVWFKIRVPETAAAGDYTGTVTLVVDGKTFDVDLKLHVFDFTLNRTMHAKTAFGMWRWMFDSVYGDDCDVDALEEAYYEFLLDYKISADWLPGSRTGRGKENESNFVDPVTYAQIAYEYAKREEVSSFEVPTMWSGQTINASRIRMYLSEMAKAVIKDGKVEFNIFDKAFLYTIDEPPRSSYDMVRNMTEDIREMKQSLADELLAQYADVEGIEGLVASLMNMSNVVTVAMNDTLAGGVDTWCPLFSAFGSGDDTSGYFQNMFEAQLEGEEMWWYGCVAPKNPYVTYHTDDSLVGPRVLGWMQKDYDIKANLYWCTNVFMKWMGNAEGYVDRDVWNDPDSFPGEGNQVNGDGYLLYPGNRYGLGNDPIATIRLSAIRDAQEDYEYLYQLEELVNEANEKYGCSLTMEEIMSDIYDTLYTGVIYVDEPELVFRARRQVAEMIEALSAETPVVVTSNLSGEKSGMTRVTVYAPEDVSVTVNGVAAEQNGCVHTAYLVFGNSDGNVLETKVQASGKTFDVHGYARGGGNVLDDAEQNNWTQEDLAVDLSDIAYEGESSLQFTAYPDEIASALDSFLVLTDKDFTKYEAIEFYAYNPDDTVVKFSFNLIDDRDTDYIGTSVLLRPRRWTKVRIDIPTVGTTNFSSIEKLRIRATAPQTEEPMNFLVDNICVYLRSDQ